MPTTVVDRKIIYSDRPLTPEERARAHVDLNDSQNELNTIAKQHQALKSRQLNDALSGRKP
jgi:hypothetical protein